MAHNTYSRTLARINTGIIDEQVRPWLASCIYDSMSANGPADLHSLDLTNVQGLARTIADALLTGRDRPGRRFVRAAVHGTYDPAVPIDERFLARSLAEAYPRGKLTSVALGVVEKDEYAFIDLIGHAMTRLERAVRNKNGF